MTDKKVRPRKPTLKEKVAVYEDLLHTIQMHAEVTMRGEVVKELIGRICGWSYSHRAGNGELSEQDQQDRINHAFWRLDIHKNHEHTK